MSLADDITRLARQEPARNRLRPAVEPRSIREATGLQLRARASANAQGDEVVAQSTDGIFTFVVKVVRG